MAIKDKPVMDSLIPKSILDFARGAEGGGPVFMPEEAQVPVAASAPSRLDALPPKAEPKRQVALRLDVAMHDRIIAIAGMLTTKTKRRISQQDIMQEAIADWLEQHYPEQATPGAN